MKCKRCGKEMDPSDEILYVLINESEAFHACSWKCVAEEATEIAKHQE